MLEFPYPTGIFGVLGYLLRFLRLMLLPKAVLAAKLLAAESQFAACVEREGIEAAVHDMPVANEVPNIAGPKCLVSKPAAVPFTHTAALLRS